MTCDCCNRTLRGDRFSCAGWCDACCGSDDCTPYKPGRSCAPRRAELLRKLALLGLTIITAGGLTRALRR